MIPSPACRERASLKKSAYVYLLRSLGTGSVYLGWTTDLKRRLNQHNASESSYTKSRGPWELVAYEEYPDCEAAKKRERVLKHNPRMFCYFKKRALASFKDSAIVRWRPSR